MLATNTSNLAQRSFAAVLWNYAGAAGRALAQIGVQVVLARLLGPQIYGQFAIVLVVMGFGWLLTESGMGTALVQTPKLSDEAIRQALGGVIVQGSVVGLGVMLAAPVLANIFDDPALTGPLLVCGPLILLQALGNISGSLMRRGFDMKRFQLIQLTAYVVCFGGLAITLARLGWGVWSLVVAFTCQTAAILIASYAIVRHPLRPLFRMDPELRKFGVHILVSNMASWTIDNLDRAVVGRLWGVSSLGAYTAAQNLARGPATLLSQSVQSVTLATASRVQDDPERLRRTYCCITGGLALVMLPAFALLLAIAEPLILMLYGDRWSEAVPIFRAFAVAMPLHVLSAVAGSFLWAIGAVSKEMVSQVLVATSLLVCFALASALSEPLAVAAWAVPFAYALRCVINFSLIVRRIGLTPGRLAGALAGGMLLGAVGAGVWELTALAPWADASLAIAAARLMLAGLAILTVLVLSRGRLLAPDLRAVLHARLPGNTIGRLAGRVLGL
ncbi:lipopolysaccharide biosynthesis protein [Aquabacterium sp. A7-Y]|uniref:lipopolysaccharide biosynthesis protein n=1 Tax=Aquabacterium sp. A7-Y TaxID=1349605 RepID=UPI00223D3595|nr:lipopolysaccharide biosynthesis protein [Aquabacterium sp. A7-Y]MCW7537305.1 lipopolysaccharide biosynthesis protein [Aquabacterium sp. A7-Y]